MASFGNHRPRRIEILVCPGGPAQRRYGRFGSIGPDHDPPGPIGPFFGHAISLPGVRPSVQGHWSRPAERIPYAHPLVSGRGGRRVRVRSLSRQILTAIAGRIWAARRADAKVTSSEAPLWPGTALLDAAVKIHARLVARFVRKTQVTRSSWCIPSA